MHQWSLERQRHLSPQNIPYLQWDCSCAETTQARTLYISGVGQRPGLSDALARLGNYCTVNVHRLFGPLLSHVTLPERRVCLPQRAVGKQKGNTKELVEKTFRDEPSHNRHSSSKWQKTMTNRNERGAGKRREVSGQVKRHISACQLKATSPSHHGSNAEDAAFCNKQDRTLLGLKLKRGLTYGGRGL